MLEIITEKIKSYLSATCLVDFDGVEADSNTDLFEAGFIDSYGFVELVTFLEREFSIKVTDDDLVTESFNSVNELVRYIGEKQDVKVV